MSGIVRIFFIMLLSGHQPLLAQDSLPISIAVFEDTQRLVLPETILNSPGSFDFTEVKGKRNFGISRSDFWFKIDLPAASIERQLILEIGYPLLDIVDIYTQENAIWNLLKLGDTRPLSSREIVHHNFLKQVNISDDQAHTIFLRTRSEGPMIVPIKVWEMAEFHHQDHNQALLEGLYFGVLLALILFNLFVYLSIRNRSYFYYVGYLSLTTLFLMSLEGLVVTYILPTNPLLTSRLPFISLYLALIVAFSFTASVNNTHQLAPGLLKVFRLFSLVIFGVLIAGLFLGVRFLSQVTPYLTAGAISLYAHAIIRGIRATYRPSYFVGFAFLMLLPGASLYALRTIGLVDTGNWPEYAFKTGVALEALLLSLVLAYRIRYTQAQLEQVQLEANRERQGFSKKMIEIRDQELQQLAMELHDGLGQNLLAIKSKLSRLLNSKFAQPTQNKSLSDAHEITQATINDVRRISHQLHPHILDRLGLKQAIIQVATDTCNAEVAVKCAIDDVDIPRSSPVALHLYRITQEAVKNCAVHADTIRVEVDLQQSDKHLQLRVEDFPEKTSTTWLDTLDYNHSFGLSNIQERVKLLGGKTDFSHNNLGGFRINITIPFQPKILS